VSGDDDMSFKMATISPTNLSPNLRQSSRVVRAAVYLYMSLCFVLSRGDIPLVVPPLLQNTVGQVDEPIHGEFRGLRVKSIPFSSLLL